MDAGGCKWGEVNASGKKVKEDNRMSGWLEAQGVLIGTQLAGHTEAPKDVCSRTCSKGPYGNMYVTGTGCEIGVIMGSRNPRDQW